MRLKIHSGSLIKGVNSNRCARFHLQPYPGHRYPRDHHFCQGTDNSASIVIRSKKMQAVHKMALRLADVDTTLQVQGESGVGKEVFADMVHANSQRCWRPLVKISCAAIPEQFL